MEKDNIVEQDIINIPKTLLQNINEIFVQYTTSGKILFINNLGIDFWEISNVKNCNIFDLIPKESHYVFNNNKITVIDCEKLSKTISRKTTCFEIYTSHISDNNSAESFILLAKERKEKSNNNIQIEQLQKEINFANKKANFSEEKFKAITNQTVEGIAVSDTSGNYVFVNPALCKMTGYSKEELEQMTVFDLRVSDNYKGTFNKSKSEKEGNTLQIPLKCKNGKILYTEIIGKKINIGNKEYVLGIVRDLSEINKVQEALVKSEVLLNEAQQIANLGYFEINYKSSVNLIVCSDTVLKIFELNTNSELTNLKDFIAFIDNEDRFLFEIALYETAKSKKPLEITIKLFINGKIKYIYLKGKHIYFNQKHTLTKCTIIDVTVTKNIEIELKNKVEEFEKLNNEYLLQNKLLSKAKEVAEENEKLKSAFLANMSHEIRTPLNAILGFARILKKENLAKEQFVQYINLINDNGNHLLNFINDIIELSIIDAKQISINYSNFNINQLLNELYKFFYNNLISLKKSEIELRIIYCLANNNAYIFSDENKLRQILNNLISNAIKFTEKGRISFGYKINDNKIIFEVSDTGIGISEEKQGIIFDRFVQAKETKEKLYGGAGLGLAVCKSYVEFLHGKIWLESKRNEGTTFFFSIPFVKGESKNNNLKNDIIFNNVNVLIVEDDISNLELLKEILSQYNFNITEANNGNDAIDIIKKNDNINIVLMDVQMPHLDGFMATKLIKQIKPDLPVIIQTAMAFNNDKIKGKECGCDDYLTKPIDLEKLLSSIKKLLS